LFANHTPFSLKKKGKRKEKPTPKGITLECDLRRRSNWCKHQALNHHQKRYRNLSVRVRGIPR